MTNEEIAAARQQAMAIRAQATALLMGADALLAAIPAPVTHAEERPALPRTLGD